MVARAALQRLGKWLVQMGAAPVELDQVAERSPSAVDRRLRDRLTKGPGTPPVLAGSIQLLGLGELKQMLGDAWEAVSGKALQIAEATIARHLSAEDEYQKYDKDTFVLVFAGLDRRSAEQRTTEISEEIRSRLLSEVTEAEIRVDHHVAEVDARTALDTGASVVDSIARQLQDIRVEMRATYDRLRRDLLERAQVVYAPVGSPRKRAVLMYRCLLDQATGQTTLKQMRDLAAPKELLRVLFDIDCVILGRVVQQLHSAIQTHGKMAFLVPLHFHTLRERELREEYSALCKAVPASYAQCLLFEIHSIPADILLTRVLELAGPMRAHGSGVVLRTRLATTELPQLATHSIFGVAIEADAAHQNGDGFVHQLAQLVKAAKPLRLNTIVHDANTVGAAEACYRAEVDYVDGEAIAQKMEAPRGIYRWGPQ